MGANFSLFPNADGSGFTLKRDGEVNDAHFESFRAATRYARSRDDSQDAMILLYDIYGNRALRFRVNIPARRKAPLLTV
jgi:hypothetical protein